MPTGESDLQRWAGKGLDPFYSATKAANRANGQNPGVNWPLRIMFATSIPSGVAEAEDMTPFGN